MSVIVCRACKQGSRYGTLVRVQPKSAPSAQSYEHAGCGTPVKMRRSRLGKLRDFALGPLVRRKRRQYGKAVAS